MPTFVNLLPRQSKIMDIPIPVPNLDRYHLPIDLTDLSYIRSQWTPIYILTVLWAISIFARHGAAWLAGQRGSSRSNGYPFPSDGRPDRVWGRVSVVGADGEQTRQLLERQLDNEMRGDRLRMRHWRDRFAKGNQIARTVLLMLLGANIFTSVPMRYSCVGNQRENTIERSVGTGLDELYFGGMSLGKANIGYDGVMCEWENDGNCGGGCRPRDPPRDPKEPQPPRKSPRLPRVPRDPPGNDLECFQCATNGITFSTMLLSWIYLAIVVLWWIMELFIVESYGVGITRTVMSLLSFPLVVAIFAIGLGRWRYVAGLNRDLCDFGV